MAGAEPKSSRRLKILVVLGLLNTAWAGFLWWELVSARRSGHAPFCSLNENVDCMKIWDAPFASSVHEITNVPIAGWGMIYGVVAIVMALLPLWRPSIAKRSGLFWVSVAGIAASILFGVVSVLEGGLCLGCLGTYALVIAYAAVALKEMSLKDAAMGAGQALTLVVVTYLLVLPLGAQTPKSAANTVSKVAPQKKRKKVFDPQNVLKQWLSALDDGTKRNIKTALDQYRASAPIKGFPPRSLVGPKDAPVRIVEFTDVQCPHCALLRKELEQIQRIVPPEMFSLEDRQFPLDQACNKVVARQYPDDTRCVGAKLLICAEDNPKHQELAAEIFENQSSMTGQKLMEMGSELIPREELETCIASPETEAKLHEDIAYALSAGLKGTPFIILNGKPASNFAPFLFAMILTGGNVDDPGLAKLKATP